MWSIRWRGTFWWRPPSTPFLPYFSCRVHLNMERNIWVNILLSLRLKWPLVSRDWTWVRHFFPLVRAFFPSLFIACVFPCVCGLSFGPSSLDWVNKKKKKKKWFIRTSWGMRMNHIYRLLFIWQWIYCLNLNSDFIRKGRLTWLNIQRVSFFLFKLEVFGLMQFRRDIWCL